MGKFDLTPNEQAIWQEFRYSTKVIIAEFLKMREREAGNDLRSSQSSNDIDIEI